MSDTPDNGEQVEVLINGRWIKATFYSSNFIWVADMEDEVWWHDHFVLEDGDTVPEDVHSGDQLPPWQKAEK